MKKIGFLVAVVLAFPSLGAKSKAPLLTVYAYDSFASKGGLGPTVKEAFEKQTGVKLTYVTFPSAGEALNQIVLEGKKSRADVLVGVDSSLLGRALKSDNFLELDEATLKPVPVALRLDPHFLSFDHGYLAFVYDRTRTTLPSSIKKLSDLPTLTSLNKKIVMADPRTSSLGLSFLMWVHAALGEKEVEPFSRTFASLLLTVSPGWSGSYSLFLKKEADLVLSYTTSPAYHIEEEKSDAFRALIVEEGHYRQIETAAVLKGAANPALAKKYLAALVSAEVQAKVPTLNWMYPVLDGVALPDSFKKLPAVKGLNPLPALEAETNRAKWVQDWTLASTRKP